MAENDEFAHGYHYGDYSGVSFYGPPEDGFWLDRFAVSNRYIIPIFRGILDRARRETGGQQVPRLASEWNNLKGWAEVSGRISVAPADAAELADAMGKLVLADVAGHCAGSTGEECLRCAAVVREFIGSRLTQSIEIFIEHN